MKAREVKRGMVVAVPADEPRHSGFTEVVRGALDSTDGQKPTRVIQLANGVSWTVDPGTEILVIPA